MSNLDFHEELTLRAIELQSSQLKALHELNAELLAALEKACMSDIKDKCKWIDEAETAIAKAEKLK